MTGLMMLAGAAVREKGHGFDDFGWRREVQQSREAQEADAAKLRSVALRQDGYAVEAFLTVPDGAVAGRFDVGDRQRLVGAFELLKRDDIRLLTLEPFEQAREPRADAVEVVGRELHGWRLAGCALAVIPDLIRDLPFSLAA